MTYAQTVRNQRDHHGKPMQTFEINGKNIKTNLGAWQTTIWNGNDLPAKYCRPNGDTRRVDFSETEDEVFNWAVDKGYTEIRFVEVTTMTKGYHRTYVWLH